MVESRSRQRKKKTSKKTKANFGKIIKRIFLFIFIIGLIGMLAGGAVAFSYIKDTPDLDVSQLQDPLSSKFYDMNGNLIYEFGTEKRTKVSIQEVPQVLKNAFIAVEDVRFEQHHGVDFKRIIGAVFANITDGFGAEGASTITQQVVKHSFLSPEKTLERKAQEAYLAFKMEQSFSKDQILEMYLNKIYFSKGAYGVAKAAQVYFAKDITKEQLEIHEAALLAGIPQSPNNYNPFLHPEAAEKRRNIVISLMAKHGFITDAEAEAAKAIPVVDSIVQSEEKDEPFDAFIDQVINEVSELEDIEISTGGLKIYTTLDPDIQTYLHNALESEDIIKYPNQAFQAGAVILDTKTGQIRAIGNGRKQQENFDNTMIDFVNSKQQPGSTIKPVLDYGPAIEYLNWSTYHQIVDEPHSYTNGPEVGNWDNEYWGQISIREALEWSRNVPALKTLQEVGLSNARKFGVGLGLDLDKQIYESHSIGGFDGVSPMQLAGAYSSFGNKGIYNKPHTVTKIEFPDGRTIEMAPEPQIAMKESTAFMITDMLQTVVKSGTGKGAYIPGISLAGKTGTTNFPQDVKKQYNIRSGGVPDIWFAGYSPEYTMSVWTGYNKTTSEHYIIGNQTQIAKQLFKVIMKKAHEGKKVSNYSKPANVIAVQVEKGSMPAKLPSEFTPEEEIITEYFIRGTEPTEQSDKYNKIEPIQLAQIEYEDALDRILIRWDYPKELRDQVNFEIQQAINGEEFKTITTTTETYFMVDNPKGNSTYNFIITAVSNTNEENRSDPIELEVTVPQKGIDLFPDPDSNNQEEDRDEKNDSPDDLLPDPLGDIDQQPEQGN